MKHLADYADTLRRLPEGPLRLVLVTVNRWVTD